MGPLILKSFIEPRMYRRGIDEIPYDRLWQSGIRALIFDIDNTLAPFDEPGPAETVVSLFAGLKERGFRICLLSNNGAERVALFNGSLGAHAVHRAGKPRRAGLKKALALMNVTAGETALIGDQLFTDILCGNRGGLYTILVRPVSGRDEFTVRLKRAPEAFLLRYYLKRHDEKNENG